MNGSKHLFRSGFVVDKNQKDTHPTQSFPPESACFLFIILTALSPCLRGQDSSSKFIGFLKEIVFIGCLEAHKLNFCCRGIC